MLAIESIDGILFSSSAFSVILLACLVNTLCFLLLNLCCDFNINLLLLRIYYDFIILRLPASTFQTASKQYL